MKILLAENDVFFQKMYAVRLQKEGFEVNTASDGEETLIKVREWHPTLILLDLIMPKKDGFQVLQELSQDSVLKQIPVLVFSTLSQAEDIEKAKKLGATDYIDKGSIAFDELLRKIRPFIPS